MNRFDNALTNDTAIAVLIIVAVGYLAFAAWIFTSPMP